MPVHAVEAVIFDLGRTLVHIRPERGLARAMARQAGREVSDLFEEMQNRPELGQLCSRFGRGEIDGDAFREGMNRALDADFPPEEFRSLWCGIFAPMPGMEALFREVAARMAVGLLSDTDPYHWTYLRETYPFLQFIERPALSYEIGSCKPDPRNYAAAAEAVGRPAGACLFVDDLPGNVNAARAAGMEAVRFEGAEPLRARLVAYGVL